MDSRRVGNHTPPKRREQFFHVHGGQARSHGRTRAGRRTVGTRAGYGFRRCGRAGEHDTASRRRPDLVCRGVRHSLRRQRRRADVEQCRIERGDGAGLRGKRHGTRRRRRNDDYPGHQRRLYGHLRGDSPGKGGGVGGSHALADGACTVSGRHRNHNRHVHSQSRRHSLDNRQDKRCDDFPRDRKRSHGNGARRRRGANFRTGRVWARRTLYGRRLGHCLLGGILHRHGGPDA